MAARRPAGAAGTSMATKRIKKEIADLSRENLGAITLTPNESNIFSWRATLPGPTGSPYEGGVFEVDIRIPDDYPFAPPHLQFITKVYHCNVASTGAICLDLLKTAWSPALSLYKVILSLSSLLTDPNPADPLVPAIAQEYKRNRKQHDATAREWVKLYAMPKQPLPIPPATAKPSATRVSASSASAARPRPSSRPPSSTPSSNPVPQIAGSRRTHTQRSARASGAPNGTIDLAESDEGSDIEVLGESTGRSANASGEAGDDRGAAAAGRGERAVKRARVVENGHGSGAGGGGGGTSADDVIVIDE